MRVGTVLSIVVAVNVLWAAAFIGYVKRSTAPVVKPVADVSFVASKTNFLSVNSAPKIDAPSSSNVVPVVAVTNSAPRAPKTLASADKKFGWQDVTNETYLDYVASLRSAGCPEKQVRNIVISDLNELFDQRRLEHAIKTDSQWWKAETFMGFLPMQAVGNANFDEERRTLLTKILGEDAAESTKLPSLSGGAVNLTGPVLGALPLETWNSVQEICARASDRAQALAMQRINEPGGANDNIDAAKMRDQTRQDLSKVLTPEQVEEFLLRYSHNAMKLRQDLRGIEVTPDEFRKIFHAIDPLEHQMQVDYGGPEALSQKQREQLEAQRDRAMKEVLAPERYAQYLATKDPVYKQAQMMAMQYGMNARAIQALYDMQKSLESKRTKIAQDSAMTPEQKSQALQSVGLEHQQTLQRLLGDPNFRQ